MTLNTDTVLSAMCSVQMQVVSQIGGFLAHQFALWWRKRSIVSDAIWKLMGNLEWKYF